MVEVTNFVVTSGYSKRSVEVWESSVFTAKNGGTSYTKGRIYQLIRNNTFPTDPGRRWILAKLLGIPPFLLGLQSLDELLTQQEASRKMKRPQKAGAAQAMACMRVVALKEYRPAFGNYWQHHRKNTFLG